jgi:diguanylate cyclase (GGDEF)-like protein
MNRNGKTICPSSARWLHQQMVGGGRVVAIVRDITERKLAEERMLHLAHHDTLTGLPNRSRIGAAGQTIAQAHRHNSAVLVAFIDLDGFKLVNDSLGHNAGDELLKVVAERMGGCLRAGDVVGRFGGDEFVLLLLNERHGVEAAPCWSACAKPCSNRSAVRSGSAGQLQYRRGRVSRRWRRCRDPADACRCAMYRAKDLGKNNCQFYTREMNATIERKLHMLEGLRNASMTASSSWSTSPRWICVRAMCSAWKRWCAGCIRNTACWAGPLHPLAEESGMIFGAR